MNMFCCYKRKESSEIIMPIIERGVDTLEFIHQITKCFSDLNFDSYSILFYGVEVLIEKVDENFLKDIARNITTFIKFEEYQSLIKIDGRHRIKATLSYNGLYTVFPSEQIDNLTNVLLQSRLNRTITQDMFIERISDCIRGVEGGFIQHNWLIENFDSIKWLEMIREENKTWIVESKKIRTGIYICGWENSILHMINITHELVSCTGEYNTDKKTELANDIMQYIMPYQIEIIEGEFSKGTKQQIEVINRLNALHKSLYEEKKDMI